MRDEAYDILKDDNNVTMHEYTDEEGMVVFYDWDDVRRIEKALHEICKDEEDYFKRSEDDKYDTSAIDYMIGNDFWTFSDEGFVCDDCGKWHFYNTNCACSYANYHIFDGYILCKDCIQATIERQEEYVQTLIDDPTKANTILEYCDLLDLGFEQVNTESYANGWYGSVDSPKKILNKAKEEDGDAEYVFSIIEDYNPFEVRFDLYKRKNKE